jgi:hypothetical protein
MPPSPCANRFARADQVRPPRHWRILPDCSITTQNAALGQEMPDGPAWSPWLAARPRSSATGLDQRAPFHRSSWPPLSTAMQNRALMHDTPVREVVMPNRSGIVQRAPSQTEIPFAPTETQKEPEAHEIVVTEPQSPLVRRHVPSLKANELPSPSTATQLPDRAQPIASSPTAPPICTGPDQALPFHDATSSDPAGAARQRDAETHETETLPGPRARVATRTACVVKGETGCAGAARDGDEGRMAPERLHPYESKPGVLQARATRCLAKRPGRRARLGVRGRRECERTDREERAGESGRARPEPRLRAASSLGRC